MDTEVLALVIGGLVALVVLLVVGLIRPLLTALRSEEGTTFLPDFLEDAARYAANEVERLYEAGYFDSYVKAGEAKMDAAIDIAVTKIEEWAASFGVVVDIPENVIKDTIQRYVWENPNIFPRTSGDNGADGQTE